MPCPRCAGFAERINSVSEEGRLVLDRCVNCGHYFGDRLLDEHRSLAIRPDPRPDVLTPTYDPSSGRLIQTRPKGWTEPAD